jgi:hypothetical protein
MDHLLNAKFQFEIRYTYILDFESHYKSILSPYLKLATGMEIHGQNTRTEYLKLLFEEDGFSIDCRWDRIVFVSEGKLNNLKNSQSALNKIFYEIFDKFTALSSFGTVTNYVMVANGVKQIEDSNFEDLVEDFTNHYLTENALSHFNGTDKDLGITTNYTRSGIDIAERFGPFNYQEDIERQNLLPFSKDDNSELKSNHGYMLQVKFYEETGSIDFNKTANLIEKIADSFENYNQEVTKL